MPRDYKVYLNDILKSIEKIESYTRNVSYNEFIENTLVADAVIRNLEIIGEAVKKLPAEEKRNTLTLNGKK